MEVITIESEAFQELKDMFEELQTRMRELELAQIGKRFITEEEAAKMLQVSIRTMRHYRTIGKIGFSKFGAKVVYLWEDMEKFLTKNHYKPF